MYQLQDSVLTVKGIGDKLHQVLTDYRIEQIVDLLLFLPLRYEDRRQVVSIAAAIAKASTNSRAKLTPTPLITISARLDKWQEYRKGRLLITRATISDNTGNLPCLWFNNKFLKNKLVTGQEYFFSGQLKNGQLQQATVEQVSTEQQQLHTGRLVPIYSKLGELKQGQIRRLLAEIIGKLHQAGELGPIFQQLHFPAQPEQVIAARERLSLEEMIFLGQIAGEFRQQHAKHQAHFCLPVASQVNSQQLPFQLTTAQKQAVTEIMTDLTRPTPMNRLLVGDVGSGKTIVAALPAVELVRQGQVVCLLAPTKILARQHYQQLQKFFPQVQFELVTDSKSPSSSAATFYVGTHGLVKQLLQLRPSLVIYDEQQRFGVIHRQLDQLTGSFYPHLLNMTATPIPRSLMLSIFNHLDLSYLDQMPNQRQMAKTWLVPKNKEVAAVQWLAQELLASHDSPRRKQALVVCPFINPSTHQASENVAAVEDTCQWLRQTLPQTTKLRLDQLHSRLSRLQQERAIEAVYQQQTDILVSTPMVEVGVDLPNADIILIQSAERFGLSSLHQLRGRVGRQGQASYCLLFSSTELSTSHPTRTRLEKFCQETDGLKLAQLDLEQRGAGNLLGYEQSGLGHLRFAAWTNLNLIEQAKQVIKQDPSRQSLLCDYLNKHSQVEIEAATN